MEFAYLELLAPGMFRIGLTTLGVAVAVSTIVGPVGTYIILTPLERLLHCLVAAFFSWPIFYSLEVVTVYLMRSRRPLQIGLAAAVVLLLAAFPNAAIGYTFQALFYSQHSAQLGFLTIYLMAATGTVACHAVFFYALCQRVRVAAAPPTPQSTADFPPPATPPSEAPPMGDASAPEATAAEQRRPLFDRVPLDPGSDLVFLKTDGRYIEVHTTTGSSRVIARFADAVSQLGDRGMQVHRSYWVAHRHTTELVKRDTQTLLGLTGGHEIPVSRTYLAAVRAAFARSG